MALTFKGLNKKHGEKENFIKNGKLKFPLRTTKTEGEEEALVYSVGPSPKWKRFHRHKFSQVTTSIVSKCSP